MMMTAITMILIMRMLLLVMTTTMVMMTIMMIKACMYHWVYLLICYKIINKYTIIVILDIRVSSDSRVSVIKQ